MYGGGGGMCSDGTIPFEALPICGSASVVTLRESIFTPVEVDVLGEDVSPPEIDLFGGT